LTNINSLTTLQEQFALDSIQTLDIKRLLNRLTSWNKEINLVGKSTLIDPLRSHILDSIQVSKFIKNKDSRIVDIGTGAGFPGIVLSIQKFSNVSLVDSNIKKIKFLKHIKKELGLSIKIIYSRIEDMHNKKFDYIVSRALANLNKLFFYSLKLSHKKTNLIFLKGQKLYSEIYEAEKFWKFNFTVQNSVSDKRGRVLLVKNLKKINA